MSRRLQLTLILFALFPALAPPFVTRRAASVVQTGNSCATPSFGQGMNYPLPGDTSSIAVGDFNQDGKPDVAMTVSVNNSAVVLPGNGSGGLGAATSFSAGAGVGSIAAADFNNDGKLDLAVTNSDSKVSILIGNGSGSFGAPVSFGAGGSASFVTTGDFNNDGKRDLVVANSVSISALLGNGDGSFGTATSFPVGNSPNAIAVADFNGDGKSDLAVSNFNSGSVSVLLGNGIGGFSGASNFSAGIKTSSVAAGDFNSDGKPDLVVVNADFFSGALSLLTGDGGGHFSAPVSTALQNPQRLAVADFNLDGKPDVVVTGPPGVRVLLGNGSGGFGATTTFGSNVLPFAVAVSDLNGDGRPDLVTAPALAIPGYISIFLNTCGAPRIEVTPPTLAFGSVTVGQIKDLTLTVRNTGSGVLTVNSVTSNNPMFGAPAPTTPFNVAAGRQQSVTVRFAPTAIANQTGTLSIASNDAANPTSNVALTGQGADPCTYTLSPASQSFGVSGGTGSVAVTAPGGCAWTATSNATWITVTSGSSGQGSGMVNYSVEADSSMSFRTGTLIIAGQTFTVRQGSLPPSSWGQQNSGTTNELRSVYFTNENEGWAAGANATFLRTTNGGATWSPVTIPGANPARDFVRVQFLDQNVGWVGGKATIARTLNGGANWTAAAPYPTSRLFVSNPSVDNFFPTSSNKIWAAGLGDLAGPAGFIVSYFANSDGSLSLGFNSATSGLRSPVMDISFRNSDLGFVIGNAGRIIFVNPGASFNFLEFQVAGTSENLNSIHLLDINRGWIVGNNGTILKSTNGGILWTALPSGTTANLRCVRFLDANRGWAVGDGGVILTTSDGGATWATEQSGVTANLRGAFFVNTNTGYAVGDGGVILKRGAPSGPTAVTTVSAASFTGAELAVESIAAAFGQGLAATTEAAASVPLPTTLAGASVRVRDSAGTERAAPLFFVSPLQINYQIPPGTAPGAASISVVRGETVVAAGTAPIATVAPGLFAANANGQGVAGAVVFRRKADGTESFEPVAQFNQSQNRFVAVPIDLGPATDQVSLILFGTGIRFRSALSAVTCNIGGASAPVSFAGAQGGFVGLDQTNISLPRDLAGRGEVDVVLTADGKAANTVKVTMK